MCDAYNYAAVVAVCQDTVDKSSSWNCASQARSLHLALLLHHPPLFFLSSPCLSPRLLSVQEFSKSRWIAYFHLMFGRPLFLFPGIFVLNTFLSVCSSSLLVTCPYQFDIPSLIFLEACTTLVVPRKCSFLILSLRVTPYIHLSILISFTLILFSCRFVVANVSAP